MSVGKRLRFEVLKRDGFRCAYCGCTALAEGLQVDHVVPVAGGGSDDPANLITACTSCNQGKSDVPLDESRLTHENSREAALEHSEQIREYLRAQNEVDLARSECLQYVCDRYKDMRGEWPYVRLADRLPGILRKHPLPRVVNAIEVVAAKRLERGEAEVMYMYGVLRRLSGREG